MAKKTEGCAGVPSNHYGRWSDDDKRILHEYWASLPIAKLHEAFPGRTKRAVIAQAGLMGLKKSEERLREMGRENTQKRWAKTGKK